jgi:uncharacterized membrane-anchored protein
MFSWIVEYKFIVADVNAHRLVYHMYRVSASVLWRAWQKRHLLFLGYFWKNSTFLIFLWIVVYISVVADVNAHLMMYHMYRTSAPVSWRAWQKPHFKGILGFFSTFLIFLWIVEYISVVADVNTHLVMCHTYRVSALMTR